MSVRLGFGSLFQFPVGRIYLAPAPACERHEKTRRDGRVRDTLIYVAESLTPYCTLVQPKKRCKADFTMTCRTQGKPELFLLLVVSTLVALAVSFSFGVAQRLDSSRAAYPDSRTVLSTGSTVLGEPIRYPSEAPAKITALEITLEPGQQTGWHTHPAPMFGYILDGELTVDYGNKGRKIYRKGDALVEAISDAHNGKNEGGRPVVILVDVIGSEGDQISVPASLPR
ncbi:MAG: cupin domain-containing protein [Xanthobacteraceae bacterium]